MCGIVYLLRNAMTGGGEGGGGRGLREREGREGERKERSGRQLGRGGVIDY